MKLNKLFYVSISSIICAPIFVSSCHYVNKVKKQRIKKMFNEVSFNSITNRFLKMYYENPKFKFELSNGHFLDKNQINSIEKPNQAYKYLTFTWNLRKLNSWLIDKRKDVWPSIREPEESRKILHKEFKQPQDFINDFKPTFKLTNKKEFLEFIANINYKDFLVKHKDSSGNVNSSYFKLEDILNPELVNKINQFEDNEKFISFIYPTFYSKYGPKLNYSLINDGNKVIAKREILSTQHEYNPWLAYEFSKNNFFEYEGYYEEEKISYNVEVIKIKDLANLPEFVVDENFYLIGISKEEINRVKNNFYDSKYYYRKYNVTADDVYNYVIYYQKEFIPSKKYFIV